MGRVIKFRTRVKALDGDKLSLLLWDFFAAHEGENWEELTLLDLQRWLRGDE